MQWHGATVGTVKGRKDVAGLFAGRGGLPAQAHASIKDIFGQGDQVAVRVVVRGTQKRDLARRRLDRDPFYAGTHKAPWIP